MNPPVPASGERLVYLMGASGSGKDTLLRLLRAGLRGDEPVLVAHRYITRDSGASEDALRLSVDEFARRAALGCFALGWASHGRLYGTGIEVDTWRAGGAASRSKPIVAPEDAKGMKVRGGSREMDMVLQTAGASVLSVPSNEIYAAMQTGACDAGITSSTSLISFRLEEVAKSLTSGAGTSYWFMLEPLMMSKAIFDKLPKNHQDILLAVGTELEAFGRKGAQNDDVEVAKVYEKAGAKVSVLDAATVGKWRDIARDTAWKDYSAKTATTANLLKLAIDVAA
jgi:TRAP-type C4-dicarboxylate transport system substrate-binding protein